MRKNADEQPTPTDHEAEKKTKTIEIQRSTIVI